MYFVYVIENRERSKIYIGYTSDLQGRIDRHNGLKITKKSAYTTRFGGDWKYIYLEGYDSGVGARRREKELKSAQGRKFLDQFRTWVSSSVG